MRREIAYMHIARASRPRPLKCEWRGCMIERRSLFDGGNFVIDFLTSSPDGFTAQTRRNLLRHAPNTPLTGAKRIRPVRDLERKKFRVGPGFAPKVGIRNPQQSESVLSFDIQPVTYPTYL